MRCACLGVHVCCVWPGVHCTCGISAFVEREVGIQMKTPACMQAWCACTLRPRLHTQQNVHGADVLLLHGDGTAENRSTWPCVHAVAVAGN